MNDRPMILVCLTTVADLDQARRIARKLLDERVAACIQIDAPIESHYHWDGKDCCDTEYRLVIKTSTGQQVRLREVLREIHPYEQPQIVILESIDVDPGYASWVESQTD